MIKNRSLVFFIGLCVFCAVNFLGFITSPMVGFFLITSNVVISAIMVVLAKNPINSLFFLIATFFNTSVFLILLNMDFIAIIFVLVYIGAISVFFLFMIMLLNVSSVLLRTDYSIGFVRELFIFLFILVILISVVSSFFRVGLDRNQQLSQNYTSLRFNSFFFSQNIYELVGTFFFTYYGISLFLISIFLLVVMIGVIILPVFVQKPVIILKTQKALFLKVLNPSSRN